MSDDATDTPPEVQLFTDGACLGNPGPGGWAAILRHPTSRRERVVTGGENETTNNRMELTAVIRGLEALNRPSRVDLCSDSEYITKGITDWLPNWKKRGFRRKGNRPVLNADLWQALDALLQKHEVRVEWTRGHAGHPENERCDQLASEEAASRQP